MESRESGAGEDCRPSAARRVGRAASWKEYWVFARVRMGMSKREFFTLMPQEFVDFRKEWLAVRRETQTMLALLRTDVINFSMSPPKRRVRVEDLLPSEPGKQEPIRRLSPKRRQAVANRIRSVFGPLVVGEED
jgi:hypothetical protein